ncbi:cell division protein ZipA [Cognaticolwellia mytili]|uniref:cell division protein ZipA n=1 Tax=Cognaticolwellia mytili TaxID=1888913 RepID=UPI000A16F03D|nr:cell division protein ZipA [Cognaticolwellia mytili]
MEGNFRNTLIIISAIVIAAIFIHGYWTIRKQKNPYKLKTKDEPVVPESRGFDGSGFDQDGVSKPKVIGNNPKNDESALESHTVEDGKEFHSGKPMPDNVPLAEFEEKERGLNFGALLNETEEVPEHLKQQALSDAPDYSDEDNYGKNFFPESTESETEENLTILEPEQTISKPLYQEPVIQAKPKVAVASSAVQKKDTRKAAIKRNQLEINFGDEAVRDMPSMSATEEKSAEKTVEITPQVIVLSVVMPEGQAMSGAALLPTLLTLGLKYGEMNIFHRHQDNAGNGQVTFSLANMMNPGTFDLDDIENFSTQGVTLFMTLPNTGDAFEVFEKMLNAAKQLAVEFKAQLLDDKRNVMTKQAEQHYMGIIREFERKSRIASH